MGTYGARNGAGEQPAPSVHTTAVAPVSEYT